MPAAHPVDKSRSRFSLRVLTGVHGDVIAVRVDDLAREAVLFDWRGAEARCLLESHELLQRHAMNRYASDRCVPISKTSIWHLTLHVAAIRCLLNRCNEEQSREARRAGPATIERPAEDAKYESLHSQVLKLLRADRCRLLSVHDVTCLLALDGWSYTVTCIGLVLEDLFRWGAVRCVLDDTREKLYGAMLQSSKNSCQLVERNALESTRNREGQQSRDHRVPDGR